MLPNTGEHMMEVLAVANLLALMMSI